MCACVRACVREGASVSVCVRVREREGASVCACVWLDSDWKLGQVQLMCVAAINDCL